MEIQNIRKRDGSIQSFDISKITSAVAKALSETGEGNRKDAEAVAELAHQKVVAMCVQAGTAAPEDPQAKKCIDGNPAVEEIQDLVEQALMEKDYYNTAKAYIIYRNARKKLRERDIFAKRQNLKPYEYPELYEYTSAIRHSYWVHTEFNFTSDVQDFHINVSESERSAIKNSMLAIAQIEVAVKTFWGDIYKKMPKPEIGAVGATFAESEVRHTDAYSHLLEILGLNDEFTNIKNIPVIQKRMNYLEKVNELARTSEDREYSHAVLLFALFVEHVSLFSQFLIMMSFNKHKNLFKGISNAVEATSKEENLHGMFGIDVINIIKDEHPEWFDESCNNLIIESCREAYEAESDIVDWIYEKGELDFLPAANVKEFIKHRLNNSLVSIGLPRIFEVSEALLEETDWFDNEVIATKHVDFFNKRSINYNKRSASVTSDDLF
ncbi:ribonucleotide-diphosphate reductase subunit beta [Candidatus Nomurabacteria bacterium]|nr:ribonucleotide-diphosphate reductase subunit beta [Candidatus Kaiserbacteria bacterium]MCB9810383.1 ribonucleotide-diphosphate reductase subunit beta [Candidatus Nomurabacteria bacterium]MCB9818035.1 ribonucleotide-diphosphate reductase subunit beta [Candidatus Nomurabacteria bacterium]